MLYNTETKESTTLYNQPFPLTALQQGQCSENGVVCGLCKVNGLNHIVAYCSKTMTIKSILNTKIKEIQSKVAEMDPFDLGPSPISDKVVLERCKKDLGLGAFYDGQWSPNGLRHGLGTQIDTNGVYYFGYWCDDNKNGRGRILYVDGTLYEGNFKNDEYDGYGTLKAQPQYDYEVSSEYVGEFENGIKHGKGKETKKSGEIYDGDFVQGVRKGFGSLTPPE